MNLKSLGHAYQLMIAALDAEEGRILDADERQEFKHASRLLQMAARNAMSAQRMELEIRSQQSLNLSNRGPLL